MSATRKSNGTLTDAPLTARSVLLSTLLGTQPPSLSVARLVAVAGLFGVSENAARVALSRMAAAGEVVAEEGRYRLTGRLLDRQNRQEESRKGVAARWRGDWVVLVVTASGREASARASLRDALRAARLAELREGVWLRPDNVAVAVPVAVETVTSRFRARPHEDGPLLAARLWDLEGWAAGAHQLLARLSSTREDLQPGNTEALAPGFVLSASVLRHLQADPLLPPALLARDWPGEELRELYDDWDRAYRAVLRQFHRTATS